MSSVDVIEILEEKVSKHLSWISLPSFYLDDSEIIESLENMGEINSVTEGHEILEGFLEGRPEVWSGDQPVSLMDGDWYAHYNLAHQGWIVERALDYERIFAESKALEKMIKSQLSKKIASLNPDDFEYLLFEIFDSLEDYGDPIKRTQTRDGGYEMIVARPHMITGSLEHILVQAKHQRNKVSVSQTRELIGSLDVISREYRGKRVSGLLVSIKGPSPDAKATAEKSSFQIDFLDLNDLVGIMFRYNIGWESRSLRFASVDKLFWDQWSIEDE